MRSLKTIVLPAFMLLMLVAMPLAESAANDLPPPATPVTDDAPIAIQGELVPPSINEVCGADNDEIIPAESQPEGVNPQPEISAWENGRATLTYSPQEGFAFPEGVSNTIVVDEIGVEPCEEATPPAKSSLMQPMNQSVVPTVTFGYPSGMYNLPNSNENTFSVDYDYTGFVFNVPGVGIPNDSDMRVDFKIRVHDGEYFRVLTQQRSSNVRDNSMVMDIDHSESFRNSCLAGHGHIKVEARLEFFHTGGNSLYLDSGRIIQTHSVPCSANYTPPAPSLQHNVCGTNNDSINIPNEYGLAISDSGWQDGVRTITYPNESWLIYPAGFQKSYTFYDDQSCTTTASFTGPTTLYGLDDQSQIEVTGTYDVSSIWPSEGLTANVLFIIYKPGDGIGSIMHFSSDAKISSPSGAFTVSTDRSDAWFDELCLYSQYDEAGRLKIGATLRFFDQGTQVWSHREDLLIPCSVSLVPLGATADNDVCGYVDERIVVPDQDGIAGHTLTWNGNEATINYSVEPGYEIGGGPYTVEVTSNPCITEPVPDPVHDRVCGIANDQVTLGDPVEGVAYETSDDWVDGVYTVQISPLLGWAFPEGQTTTWRLVDEGDCVIEELGAPVHTEVCGPNNDTIVIPPQPENVNLESDTDWVDGVRTITFVADEGYSIPDPVFEFDDQDTPCPTDAPAAPVQAEVCGPNNDELVIPPQPEGVTLDEDTGWIDGIRTITFVVDPTFITDGETEFSYTDENIACPITLNVTLIPSDGGSLAGAEWQLFALVAAQNFGTNPFAEGTVGADNSIVIEDLIAGDYRLLVDPEGYEPIDTVLTVTEGEQAQEIRVDVLAVQPVETPTPELTPASEPTQEPVSVTRLPDTGSGSGTGFGFFALAGLIVTMVLTLIGGRRRIKA